MPRKAPYGVQRGTLCCYIPIPAGTGAVEFITDWVGGFKFTIESVKFYVAVAGTGTGATRPFRLVKNASTVVATGNVTLAGTATVGAETALTVTAANADFDDTDTLTLDVSGSGTAFTAGALRAVIAYRQSAQRVAD